MVKLYIVTRDCKYDIVNLKVNPPEITPSSPTSTRYNSKLFIYFTSPIHFFYFKYSSQNFHPLFIYPIIILRYKTVYPPAQYTTLNLNPAQKTASHKGRLAVAEEDRISAFSPLDHPSRRSEEAQAREANVFLYILPLRIGRIKKGWGVRFTPRGGSRVRDAHILLAASVWRARFPGIRGGGRKHTYK